MRLLSVVIPVRNEAGNISQTLEAISSILKGESIPFEIIVVNDHSTDNTGKVVDQIQKINSAISCVENDYPGGFGYAIRKGLDVFRGDFVVIVMGDSSDDCKDIVRYYREYERGAECVFGSRFLKESRVTNYPFHKLILNRLGNKFIQPILDQKQ